MNDLLFEVPWWIPSLLAVIGVAVFINGNKSQVLKVRNLGVGLVLLAIVWALVSYFVDTDKEKVEKAMEQTVQAAGDGDWAKFQSHLAADVSFAGAPQVHGAGPIATLARGAAERIHLKSAHVHNMVLQQNGAMITVTCDIDSQQEIVPLAKSSWLFTWELTGHEWKLHEIRMTALNGQPWDVGNEGMPGIK